MAPVSVGGTLFGLGEPLKKHNDFLPVEDKDDFLDCQSGLTLHVSSGHNTYC